MSIKLLVFSVRYISYFGCLYGVLLGTILLNTAPAQDWPTYRRDAARSGISSEELGTTPNGVELVNSWIFQPSDVPQPAWGDPKPVPVEKILELRRVHFDDAFQIAAVGDRLFFGSSANGKVYCLDANTGRIIWTAITGGPVRLAPMVVDSLVYVGSDDGHVYCLRASDGSQVWKFRGAPEERQVLGSGKMISLYPVRTGVLVDRGVAYFAAGIFPSEGVFLYALDAKTGKVIWRNGSFGESASLRPAISPQGYLLASPSSLYAPMGRVSPAAFDRSNGQLKYSTFFGKTVGGTYALLADKQIYTGTEEIQAYDGDSRDRFATFQGRKMLVADDVSYLATDTHLLALDRKNKTDKKPLWKTKSDCRDELIMAGKYIYAGGPGRVMAIEAASGKIAWQAQVEGRAKGLAVANRRLIVSTDTGAIYSFVPKPNAPATSDKASTLISEKQAMAQKNITDQTSEKCCKAAEFILEESGVRKGYCLVLGCETGRLALELARRSNLTVYAVATDTEKATAARKTIDAAGLYGSRVRVEHWPLDAVPYANYFANLVVSETALLGGKLPPAAEAFRMLKPNGGVLMMAQPQSSDAKKLRHWLDMSEMKTAAIVGREGGWAKFTRDSLPGSGSWTHQYADAGNSTCGDDQLVKPPFGVLWFGRPGPKRMVNRHQRAVGPLSRDGRLFVQGEGTIMAYDAYNGLKLWQRELPQVSLPSPRDMHRGSNLALGEKGLFVASGKECLRLDPATGKTLTTYEMPREAIENKKTRWGYMALVGDTLFGSHTANSVDSSSVFAIDVTTAKPRWLYNGKRIPHNAIAIGDGRVFFVSSTADDVQRERVMAEQRKHIEELPEHQREKALSILAQADIRMAVALDVASGKPLWQKAVDVARLPGKSRSGSMNQAAIYSRGVLILFGVYLDGHYWKEFFAGDFDARRVAALSGKDGKTLWDKRIGFRVRPIIVGDTLHAEPWAFDLFTGKQRTRINPVSGRSEPWQFARPGHHCGCPAGTPNCLLFRSWYLGHYDLTLDSGTMLFGGQRPGCWINFIPAGGLLLVPEGSVGCMCAFPTACSIAFEPVQKNRAWSVYSTVGGASPVKQLALNLGMCGDRKDAKGQMWLGLPRPRGVLVLKLKTSAEFYPGGKFICQNSTFIDIDGSENDWLFASAAEGLKSLSIPLLTPQDGRAAYRVCLTIPPCRDDKVGQRVFDIKLQGKIVRENFDAAVEAKGKNQAIIVEFNNVPVSDKLLVELLSKQPAPDKNQWPVVSAVEIQRQRVLELGCGVPRFVLSTLSSQKSGEISLSNLAAAPFEGSLVIDPPKGLEVHPKQFPLILRPDSHCTKTLNVRLTDDMPEGDGQIAVRLLGKDGSERLHRSIFVKNLGLREQVVIRASEDAHVMQRYPNRNQGSAGVVFVDGGEKKNGDRGHSLAFYKFPIDLPGKSVSVVLRLQNAGNPSRKAGSVCLVNGPFKEKEITYKNRPKTEERVGSLVSIAENETVECPLDIELAGRRELGLAVVPESCDAVDFISREGGKPAELVIEYAPTP